MSNLEGTGDKAASETPKSQSKLSVICNCMVFTATIMVIIGELLNEHNGRAAIIVGGTLALTNVLMTYNTLERIMKTRGNWKAKAKGGKSQVRPPPRQNDAVVVEIAAPYSRRRQDEVCENSEGSENSEAQIEEIRRNKSPKSDRRRNSEKHERVRDSRRVKRKKSKSGRSRDEDRHRKRGSKSGEWSRSDRRRRDSEKKDKERSERRGNKHRRERKETRERKSKKKKKRESGDNRSGLAADSVVIEL